MRGAAAIVLVSALALSACNGSADAKEGKESGRVVSRSYDVTGFDKVSLGGSQDVVVKVGGQPSVRAEGDEEAIQRLEIRVEGGELRVGQQKRNNWSIGFGRDRRPVTVYVTVPSLSAASIGGSGNIRIDRVEGNDFSADIGGSGAIDVAAMKIANGSFSVAGSGKITAAGTAQSIDASIAGSGDIRLGKLETRRATVSLVGSGDVSARAMESADVSIMGSGSVDIAGTAKCNVHKMGSGEARCTG